MTTGKTMTMVQRVPPTRNDNYGSLDNMQGDDDYQI